VVVVVVVVVIVCYVLVLMLEPCWGFIQFVRHWDKLRDR
jgi:hypothetical protein